MGLNHAYEKNDIETKGTLITKSNIKDAQIDKVVSIAKKCEIVRGLLKSIELENRSGMWSPASKIMRGKRVSQKDGIGNLEELRGIEIDRLGNEEMRQISHDDWLDEIGLDRSEEDKELESELCWTGDEVSSRTPTADSTPPQDGETEVKDIRSVESEKDTVKEGISGEGGVEGMDILDDIGDNGMPSSVNDGDVINKMMRAEMRSDRVSTGKQDNSLGKTLTRLRSVKDELCDHPYCPLSHSSSPLRFEACDIATTAYAAFTPPHAYFINRNTFEDDTQPYTSTSSGDEWGTGRNDENEEQEQRRRRDMRRVFESKCESGYNDNHKSFDDDNSEDEDESDNENTEDDEEGDVGVHIGDEKKYFNCHGCGRRCNVKPNLKLLRKINEEEKDKEKDEYYSSFFVSSFAHIY